MAYKVDVSLKNAFLIFIRLFCNEIKCYFSASFILVPVQKPFLHGKSLRKSLVSFYLKFSV